jgi:WhiB family redox-sensing transcriptional regulator
MGLHLEDQVQPQEAGHLMAYKAPDWMTDAKCAGHWHTPNLWFPSAEQPKKEQWTYIHTARHICTTCPVTEQCLRTAEELIQLSGTGISGIWAGQAAAQLSRKTKKKKENTE